MSFGRDDELKNLLQAYPQYAEDIHHAVERLNRQTIPLETRDIRALLRNEVHLGELLAASPNVEHLIITLVNLNQANRLIPKNIALLQRYPKLADLIADSINEVCDQLEPDFNDEIPVFLDPSAEGYLMTSFENFNTAMERLESNNIRIKDYRDTLYRHVKEKDKVISMMIELNKVPGLLNPGNFKALVQYHESNEFCNLLNSFAPGELNQAKFNDVILKVNKGNLFRFIKEAEMKSEDYNKFRHTAYKMKKKVPESLSSQPEEQLPKKFKNTWYVKEIKDHKNIEEDVYRAQMEVVAQEFFRLLIPGQPKTRLIVDDHQKVYVSSKEIEGYQEFPQGEELVLKMQNRKLFGLGEVAIIAILMGETDFKFGNLGINNEDRVYKFDGSECFACLGGWERREITEYEIEMSPFPGNYNPNHWLGMIEKGVRNVDYDFIFHLASADPNYRADVNRALLKVSLLSDDLIKKFIHSYTDDPRNLMYDEFMLRRTQLVNAALKNESFVKYVNSPEAGQQFNEYVDYLSQFKTTGKNYIFESPNQARENLQAQFNTLQTKALSVAEPVISDASLESKEDDELLQRLNQATQALAVVEPARRRRLSS